MRKYFIHDGQLKKGPLQLEELKEQPISRETPVWYDGLTEWSKAGDLEELKEFFIEKNNPPPLPKSLEVALKDRDKLLNSFGDAGELYPETKRRSFRWMVILSFVVIAGILVFLFFFNKIF